MLTKEADDKDIAPSLNESLASDPEDELEDGDRIFATGLSPPSENIRASGTTSQRLAEAFHKNSQSSEKSTGFREHIPDHL